MKQLRRYSSAVTLLDGQLGGHPACKKTERWFVDGDDDWSFACLNRHVSSINKIQNGNILVPVNPDSPRK